MESRLQDKMSTTGVSKDEEEKWVMDSTVDHRGRVPARASTGVWKAYLFILALELLERMSFYGILANLITYLTKVMNQDLKTAAKNVNYLGGVTKMSPLIGGFVADAYMGRYLTVVVSSLIYIMALSLMIMPQFIPSLKPCDDTSPRHKSTKQHEIIFFIAMYMISLAAGGHHPSLESFAADQFDNQHSVERRKKMSFFNLWTFSVSCGLLLGFSVIVYIEDNVSWGVAFIVLTSAMAISTAVFFLGRPFYRYNAPGGSPLTPMLRVLVAAIAKRNLPYPSNPAELYEGECPELEGNKRVLSHTTKLRFLDKAAIVEHSQDKETQIHSTRNRNPWRLTTVTEVEATKLVINVVPIWLTSMAIGLCNAQSTTFFVKQGSAMNRKLFHDFEIPPASIGTFISLSLMITLLVYDRLFIPALRRVTGNERGITILQRIGIGLALSIAALAIAAIVERRRLSTLEIREVPMSVFWLVPQFMILGMADGFTLVGLQEYFYGQVPDNMRSLGIAIFISAMGVSEFLSSLLITLTDHVKEMGGSSGWFAKDLNKSRLDCFYWLIAVISGINLCVYVPLAQRYSYKNDERKVVSDDNFIEGEDGHVELQI